MEPVRPEADLKARARELYLSGMSLEQVAEHLGLSLSQVKSWAALGHWDQRRKAWLSDARGAAASLREVLGQKVEAILATGDLDKAGADELAKIAGALAKLEGSSYDLRAAAVEVIERLAKFTASRETDVERREWLSDLLDAFFAALVREA